MQDLLRQCTHAEMISFFQMFLCFYGLRWGNRHCWCLTLVPRGNIAADAVYNQWQAQDCSGGRPEAMLQHVRGLAQGVRRRGEWHALIFSRNVFGCDLVGCKPPDNRHRVPYMVVVMMINAYSSWSMTVAIALDLVLNRTSRQDFSRVRSARDEKRLD